MNLDQSPHFVRSYSKAPKDIQQAFDKQSLLLLQNLRDPLPRSIPIQHPHGYSPGAMPAEFTGGLGDAGAQALIEFTRAGGTLVFLNGSTAYATGHLGVPVKNAVSGVPSRDFYCPGSLLNVTLDQKHPLTRGLPAAIAIWSETSAAWEVPEGTPARSIARYPSSGVLTSGWLRGERYLAGRSPLVEFPMGNGRIVLFGMRPQYRAQSYQGDEAPFQRVSVIRGRAKLLSRSRLF